jgi:hypothetical protein
LKLRAYVNSTGNYIRPDFMLTPSNIIIKAPRFVGRPGSKYHL